MNQGKKNIIKNVHFHIQRTMYVLPKLIFTYLRESKSLEHKKSKKGHTKAYLKYEQQQNIESESQTAWDLILALPLASFVTLGKLLQSELLHLSYRGIIIVYCRTHISLTLTISWKTVYPLTKLCENAALLMK